MRKITLTLLGLTAIMSVTGCKATSQASGGSGAEIKYQTPPEDLIVDAMSFSIKVDPMKSGSGIRTPYRWFSKNRT